MAEAIRREPGPDPTAFGPIDAALFSYWRRRIRVDLAGLPWVEYAVMAKSMWGVESEGDPVLDLLGRSNMLITCVRPAWSWLAGDDVSRDPDWHDRWHRSAPWNPFAQESGFAAAYLAPGASRTAESNLTLWDRGAASTRLVYNRLWQIAHNSTDPVAARQFMERELAVDPWSPSVHILLINHLAERADWETVRAQITRSRSYVPNSPGVNLAEAGLLDRRGSRAAAIEVVRRAIARQPSNYALWKRHVELLTASHRLKAVRDVLHEMQARRLDAVGTASLVAEHAERYLERGHLAEARQLVDRANQLEAWQGSVLGATAQVAIRERRVPEGLDIFRKAMERYPSSHDYHGQRVDALLGIGQRDEAVRFAAGTPRTALANTCVAVELARIFLSHGEKALGLEWLDRARSVSPKWMRPRDLIMLERPKLATNLTSCSDRAVLSEWTALAAADPGKYSDVVDRLARNPNAAAVDCLLDAMRMPTIAREAAVGLAGIAMVDVDLPEHPTPAQLDAARQRLAAWWVPIRARYAGWQLE
jgi:tetratricopeptide (TPR) repeat protein